MASPPLVSILTPVFNGETTIRSCVESVLAQTYRHWDYTIVNNCSTDRTLDIAREYAARDCRIRVHDNETSVRVIANHNIAFRQVSPDSKYCKVVAADDWLFPECLERMVGLAEAHPTVGIVGAYGLRGTQVEWTGLPYPSTVVPGREPCRLRLLSGRDVFGAPTSVLYRSDIVRSRQAFFNESNLHGDSEACFEVLQHCDFGFVHQVLSCRGEGRPGSMSAFAETRGYQWVGAFTELVTYGPRYLTEDELRRRIRAQLRGYYQYLGRQLYARRDAQFWALHREKLGALGFPLSRVRVAVHAALCPVELLLEPKWMVEKIARMLRGRT